MQQADAIIERLRLMAGPFSGDADEARDLLADLIDLLMQESAVEKTRVLERLAPLLKTLPSGVQTWASLACGALVEMGADPLSGLDPMLDALEEVLVATDSNRTAKAPGEFFFNQTRAPESPNGSASEETVDAIARATVQMLARSIEARRRARARARLSAAARTAAGSIDTAAYLVEMLAVLDDEELLILHPEQAVGYRVVITGVADNFQLHTLLAATLIGNPFEGWIAGSPIPDAIAAAARDADSESDLVADGRFDMFSWRAIQPDGTLPVGLQGSDHWIWGEGIPAEIEPFGTQRVILLSSPPAFHRQWTAGRRFEPMHATLRVSGVLTAAEVREWIQRLIRGVP